ncbi:hypothetical protein CAL18_12540 [Bordetella genomosp. 7]|uniref:hypothetical protein n=1 Tax=Bordetella genomosp. 7 TaxID=1416805 RepID=UPI000B9E8FB9|nr:hypothetical protein [Bordetella genomosp. 7]OZI21745.1 hypothetical protein CAL18_12540 [Bordetella genomosp. 7]
MKPVKKLEYARWVVAGAIFGAALAGSFLGSLDISLAGLDMNSVGAIVGAAVTALMVKAVHLV